MAFRTQSGTANAATGTTVVVTQSGIVLNDIVLIGGMCGGSGTLTPTSPGFSAVPGLSNVNVNGSTFYALYKVAGGSEPGSYAVTPGDTDFFTAQLVAASGRNTSNPFTAVASTGAQGPTAIPTTYSASSVTAANADDIIVFYGVEGPNSGDTISFSTPTGFANPLTTENGGTFNPSQFMAFHANVSAGATGTISTSVTDTSGKTLTWAAFTIALAVAAASQVPYMPYAFQPTMAQ